MVSKHIIPILILLAVVDGPLFLLAFSLKKRLPGEINRFYGYRTTRSMKNKATWVEANQYSSKIFYMSCLCSILVQVVAVAIWDGLTAIKITLAFILIQVLIVFILTETHLDKFFDKQGEAKD